MITLDDLEKMKILGGGKGAYLINISALSEHLGLARRTLSKRIERGGRELDEAEQARILDLLDAAGLQLKK